MSFPATSSSSRKAADARVVDRTALKMAEAALTGESLPVSKDVAAITGDVGLGDRDNMIYSGTSATYGRGRAVQDLSVTDWLRCAAVASSVLWLREAEKFVYRRLTS